MFIKSLILLDIDGTLVHNSIPFISFDDVRDILPKLYGRVELGLFSQGLGWFQLGKLRLHGYTKYFSKDQTYIGLNKLALLNKIVARNKDTSITIVDNQLNIIHGVERKNLGIKTVFIDRKLRHKGFSGTKIESFYDFFLLSSPNPSPLTTK